MQPPPISRPCPRRQYDSKAAAAAGGHTLPRYDFPFALHKFISETSKTHPKVVGWSACGNYFYIRDGEELSQLIEPHFRRKFRHAKITA